MLDVTDDLAATLRRMTPDVAPGSSAAGRFGGLLPAGFPAYARILHAAWDGDRRLRWSELAHSEGWASFAERVGAEEATPGAPDLTYAEVGRLPDADQAALVEVLRHHTTAPDDLLVAVWEGGGAFAPEVEAVATLGLPSRRCRVFGARMAEVALRPWSPVDAALPAPPTQWWPRDEAWVVATDADADYTAVAGSAALVQALRDDPWLEVEPADLSSPR